MYTITLIALFCSAALASSQVVLDNGKAPQKKRSPELEELSFMVGTWNSDYVLRQTAESKEFKGKSIAVIRWSANGQFLISDEWDLMPASPGLAPRGWLNKVSVTTWDPLKREYRISEITGLSTTTYRMLITRRTGTIQGEFHDGNDVTKTTMRYERVSDTETKMWSKCSLNGGPEWIFSEGRARKNTD